LITTSFSFQTKVSKYMGSTLQSVQQLTEQTAQLIFWHPQ